MKNFLSRLKLIPSILTGSIITVFVDKKDGNISFHFGCSDKSILKQMSLSLFKVVYNLK